MHYNMANQVAVVTAGTMGIGRAIVDLLLGYGANVAVCARDGGRLEELGASLASRRARRGGIASAARKKRPGL